ncbi:citrate/2-methylcitrate synthase [Halomicroarcula sp. GCM10025709]|uniref:citrate/2-methylcitrate synthase n=1 Tax=Haloarcula TaxID=2237 RepID=UPI0024C2D0F0|nr:citrate/2-methylcitrate synthase [Halomicroarcula sp. YJ-61-S]
MTPSVFDPGLESITVAETELSDVDGEAGELVVRGYPIAELAANATYEESVALLLDGDLPPADRRETVRAALTDSRGLDDAVRTLVETAAAAGVDPMDALRMGVAAATLGTDDEGPSATALRVIAVVPTVVGTYWRARRGESVVDPDPSLSHAANYRYMVTGERPTAAETRALDAFLTTIVDHGLNPSTFTARTVVSTESDLVSAATAAVGTLKGPRHGGNLRRVFELLRTAHEADDVGAAVRERLADGDDLPGFGHRVYEVRDPRAAVLSAAMERLPVGGEFRATVRDLESAGVAALDDRFPRRHAAATVEFYAAALLYAVDIPPALFTPTFAVARVAGWMAHCLEQRADNVLVRPVSRYVGPTGRTWTPVEEREPTDGVTERAAVEPVSETLQTLAEPARLEVLFALAAADGPVAYSTLRERTSIEDNGRFNYHLRQLRGAFVADGDAGYALTAAGERFVETVLADDAFPADP